MAKGFKTGGRTAGTPNKENKELRELILGALEEVGGQEYLKEQAKANPTAFMSLISKVLPKDLNVKGDLDVIIKKFFIDDKPAS